MRFLRSSILALATTAIGLSTTAAAAADEPAPVTTVPHPYAYGILVGSNPGGAGQQTLRYAEDDARRMADVLQQLGRYGKADMRVLIRPDQARVFATIDEIAGKLREHQQKGEQAVLVFYYSGHAKANAFNLGGSELAITALRDKLQKLPTTLTLIVLDACQSGQFARTKGTEAAADFSFNSVSRLTTKGIAVMASSSAQELSQESDQLKSSYFTHHLVVGLRGAADSDGDGRVSVDEAYRYAYRRTLASTAQTQVGSQHVTLETDLAGQGDVPVTYPSDAKSQLELPGPLDARVLVQHKPSGNVVAEVHKAAGAPLRLAFVGGSYEALVRPAGKVLRCRFTLADSRVTTLDLGACDPVKLTGIAKGDGDGEELDPDRPEPAPVRETRAIEPWALELGFGPIWRGEDAYTRRLNEFGYAKKEDFFSSRSPRWRAHLGVSHGLVPHVSIGGYVHTLTGDTYERDAGDSDDSFSWDAYGASGFVRAATSPIGQTRAGGAYFDAYGQLGGGLTLGVTKLTTASQRGGPVETTTDTYFGWSLGGFAGLSFVTPTLFAFFLQGGYEYAPTIPNLVGDVHDAGGPSVQLGMRLRFQ